MIKVAFSFAVFQANKSKIVSKASYFILLLFAAAATVITVFACSWDEHGDGKALQNPLQVSASNRRRVIIGLSLATAVLTGLVTFLKPTARWMELRGGALTLESELWQFRTRSGPYRPRPARPPAPGGGEGIEAPLALSIVNRFCMARFYGRAGPVTAHNGGRWPRAVLG